MNKIAMSLTELEDFGKGKTAKAVLTEVFAYPKVNILGAYKIKITNELQLNLDLTNAEKDLLTKYKLALENIISNVRKPLDDKVLFDSYIKEMFNSTDNADSRALTEVMPNKKKSKLLEIYYNDKNRLVVNPAYNYDEMTKVNNYVIDKHCNTELLVKTFENVALNLKNLASINSPRQKVFKQLAKYQEVRAVIVMNAVQLLTDRKLEQIEINIKFYNVKQETLNNRVKINFVKDDKLSITDYEVYDVNVEFEN